MRYKQFCALARATELLAERWTLLIVRELLLGPRRFADLKAGLPGISSSVLTQRLSALIKSGLIQQSEWEPPAASTVYELTRNGQALRPAIYELIRWGGRFLFPPRRGERFDPRWLVLALSACARKKDAPEHAIELRMPDGKREIAIHIRGGPEGTLVEERSAAAEVTIRVSDPPTVLEMMAGRVRPSDAMQRGRIQIEGDPLIAALLPQFFEAGSGRKESVSL